MIGKIWKKLVNRGDHFLPDLWRADYAGRLDQLLDMRRAGIDYRLATAGSWAEQCCSLL